MKKTLLLGLLLSFGYSNSQTFVSTTAENKKVILEEFTGVNCVYCPQGHTIANTIKNNNPENVFLVNIHVGGYAAPSAGQPDFRTPFGTAIAGQTGVVGYPAATVNRSVFAGLNQGAVGTTAMNRNNWTNAANQTLTQSSYVNVGVQGNINITNNVLTVTVETYYTGNSPVSTNKLNVALLQNNTKGPQTGGNMGNNYNHQHRLVHMISGQWGTEITTTTSGSFNTQTFTYTIPAAYNSIPVELSDLELVAFVSETNQKIISGNGANPTFTGLAVNDAKVKSIATIPSQCTNTISPKISIQNLSQTSLTSLPINYEINSGGQQTYTWTGNLAPLASTEVTLPSTTYSIQSSNTLNVSIPSDDDNANNSGSTTFNKAVDASSTNFTIKITLDAYGSETAWNIKNSAGVTVAQNPTYSDSGTTSGTYPQADINITLPSDCYTFSITDTYGDGMCCSYGTGGYQLLSNGVLVAGLSGGAYGGGEAKNFSVNQPLGINEFNANAIKFYPNPTSGILNISLLESSKVTITDLSGKMIHSSNIEAGESTINLSSYAKGLYMINFAGENYTKTDKIILK